MNSEPFGVGSAKLITANGDNDILKLPADEIIELYKKAGVLIFRGFETNPVIMKAFADQFSYRYNRDRLRVTVQGSNGFVQMVTEGMGYVEPHAEQANSPFRADAIWFCCQTPSSEGGETLFWDGIRVWERLDEELKGLFRSKKLRFFQRYAIDKWQLFLGEGATSADVQKALDGVEGVSYHLTADQSLYLEYVCSAVVKTKYGNKEAFANSLLSERENTLGELFSFDDGSVVSEDVIRKIKGTMDDVLEEIVWQSGDLAFIDNSRVMHGRNAYTDTRRKIFSSMSFLKF